MNFQMVCTFFCVFKDFVKGFKLAIGIIKTEISLPGAKKMLSSKNWISLRVNFFLVSK